MSVVQALLASFLVYLVPLGGPHAIALVGEVLLRAAGRRVEGWGMLCAAGLGAQLALGALAFGLRRRRRWVRAAALAAGWAACAVGLNAAMLVVIPLATQIERDGRPETNTLSEECSVAGASLHGAEVPSEVPAAGEALLSPHGGETLRLLRMPGCRVEETAIPAAASAISLRAGARALFGLVRPPDARTEWFLARDPRGPAQRLALDRWRPGWAPPRLLADGRTLAWIEPRLTPAGFAPTEPPWGFLHLENAQGRVLAEVPLAGDRGSTRIVDGTGPGGPFSVVHEAASRRFLLLDAAGRPLRPPLEPQPGVALADSADAHALLPEGWLAWDLYVEGRRQQVSWDLPGGRGRIEIPRGSGVAAAAADATGRFVAYSTTSQLSIGSTADTVVVLRAFDAAELMRRRFPKYHRSQVALLGAGQWFALTDMDAGIPRVRVYALPAKESPR